MARTWGMSPWPIAAGQCQEQQPSCLRCVVPWWGRAGCWWACGGAGSMGTGEKAGPGRSGGKAPWVLGDRKEIPLV